MIKLLALVAAPLAISAGSALAYETYNIRSTPMGGYRMSGPSGTTNFRRTPMGGYRYDGPGGSGTIRSTPMGGVRINHTSPSSYW